MRRTFLFALAGLLALPAAAEVPRVVTDIAPVGSLVAQVMGDLGSPVVLLDQGASAHSFQLRASQAAALAGAQMIVRVGPELTPWLDRAMAGLNGTAVDVSLLNAPGTRLRFYADSEAEAGHDHDGPDPHAWLDPKNAAAWLADIARQLSTLDPDNAATYTANAAAAQADVARLDAELARTLAPAQATPLVVFHDAYGYFAARYGLTVLGAIGQGDAAPPGAAHLRDLRTRMTATPACLFPETNHDPKLLQTLADGTGARIGTALDPEGASLPNGPALYADLMRALAAAIAACAAA